MRRRRRENFRPTVHWWLRWSRRFACGSIYRDPLAQLVADRKTQVTCPDCIGWLADRGCWPTGKHVWPFDKEWCFCEVQRRKYRGHRRKAS